MGYTAYLLLLLLICLGTCYGQSQPAATKPSGRSDSLVYYLNGTCKQTEGYTILPDLPNDNGRWNLSSSPLITIHGNVQYDFIYRSLVDTPFAQKDFSQHSIQTSMDLVYKRSYPFRLTMLARQSNSLYFSNIADVNFQFNRGLFYQQIRDDLRRKMDEKIRTGNNMLENMERQYQQKQRQLSELRNWINDPARLYELAAEKDRLMGRLPALPRELPDAVQLKEQAAARATALLQKRKDSLTALGKAWQDSLSKKGLDSLEQMGPLKKMETKKKELDSLVKELKTYEEKLRSVQKSVQDSISRLKGEIARINDPASLKEFMNKTKSSARDLPKGWQVLGSVTTFGVGRTWVDYSELTVKNISLTGINAAMNPGKYYFAFAAGRINARFRDFVIRDQHLPPQSLFVVRAGIGHKEKNNVIVTYYNGKRSLLYTVNNQSGPEKVMGFSIESRVAINENNYVVLETARSSYYTTGAPPGRQDLMKKVWDLRDGSNQAYSIRVYSSWPSTSTRITGYYRKTGEHFQSFNLLPVNVGQEAFQVKVLQGFWKNRLSVEAGIRKNDFNNPYSNTSVSSKTVFKSFVGTLRIPKYPMVSIGYYPSSQLTVLDNQVIVENQYNTLTGMISHAWRIGPVTMSSNAVHIRFYNHGADTGFIYYNASSWSVSHAIFWNKLQSQSGFTYTKQQDLKVVTIEQSLGYQLMQWLSVSAGGKYNRVNKQQTLWGGMAGLTIDIPKIGALQLNYDRSFLPCIARNLLPVDMGRIGFNRTF